MPIEINPGDSINVTVNPADEIRVTVTPEETIHTTVNPPEQINVTVADGAPGIPGGGTTGQVLKKTSNGSFDVEWGDGATPGPHTHPVEDIEATGTASSSTYLRGDGAWATPAGGAGGGAWGEITGDLVDQTDLQAALDAKADEADLAAHTGSTSNPHSVTKSQVGLGNVPNTDATARANHTGTQAASTISDFASAADARITAQKAQANGLASLGADSKVPTSQLPALAVTDVFVVNSQSAQLALTAEEGDVAVRTDLNKSYIHNGGTAGTMSDWQELLTPTDAVISVNGQTGAVTVTKSDVGLANVDNTSDANKPISTLTQAALDDKSDDTHTHTVHMVMPFSRAGVLATDIGVFRIYNDTGSTWTIAKVRATVGTAPTGAAIIVDVNVNDTTIYGTQANRPTVADGSTTGIGGTASTTTITDGQYFTVDIDQVGTTVDGSDLVVQITLSRSA